MLLIPDDPIVRCIERTGYPPWMHYYPGCDYYDKEEEPEDDEEREENH